MLYSKCMRSITFIGIVLLAVGLLIYYFTGTVVFTQVLIGGLCGVGIGLIIGGMVGYVSKGNAVKAEARRQEFRRLQQENAELEKQAAAFTQTEEEAQKNCDLFF